MLKTSGLLHPDDRQDELKQVDVYKSHSKFMKTKVELLCMPPRATLQPAMHVFISPHVARRMLRVCVGSHKCGGNVSLCCPLMLCWFFFFSVSCLCAFLAVWRSGIVLPYLSVMADCSERVGTVPISLQRAVSDYRPAGRWRKSPIFFFFFSVLAPSSTSGFSGLNRVHNGRGLHVKKDPSFMVLFVSSICQCSGSWCSHKRDAWLF